MNYYKEILEPHFELHFLDCCELGQIDLSRKDETAIHQQFVSKGIDLASQKLVDSHPSTAGIIAFSIGGTIAWKAIRKGLQLDLYYAISATRLRYENESIDAAYKLFYCENDIYKPTSEWFNKMETPYEILADSAHTFYQKKHTARQIAKDFILNYNTL